MAQHAGIVGVEHGEPVRQAARPPGRPFSRAMASREPKVSRCAGSTVVTTATCGGAMPAQPRHLAEVVGGHLEDGDSLVGQQLAQRDGQAVEAVVVGPVLEDGERPPRTAAIASLVGGLAHAAGDADDLGACGEDEARPVLDGLPGVGHDDAGGAEALRSSGLLAEDAGHACPARVGDVVVPVGAFGPDCQEKLAGLDQARVVAE